MGDFVTVNWLTETEIFREHIELVAGKRGLDKQVTYVTVQEAPDFYTLLDGGEFVLSTWYAFRDNMDSGLLALKNLGKSNAAGVCIKIHRFIDEIPQSYIDYANDADLPLFVVGRNVNFREIIKCITIEINMSQMNAAIRINEYYDFLFKAALENGSADFMLADFLERTGLVAISMSPDLRQVRGQKSLQKIKGRRSWLESLKKTIKRNQSKLEYFFEEGCHVFPCVARGYCYGYLVIASEEEISAGHRLYISQLRNIITIKWLDRQEKENDQLISLLDMIMHAPETDAAFITDRLKDHSIELSTGVRAVILKQVNSQGEAGNKIAVNEAKRFLIAMSARIPNLLSIWDRSDKFTILIDNQGCGGIDKAPSWTRELNSLLDHYPNISVAIGPSVNRVPDIRTSIRVATNAHIFAGGERIAYYGNHLPTMALMSGANSTECRFFIDEVMSPIVRYDEDNNGSLMETLESMISSSDIGEAAVNLCVHINSVRYRLQKIKALTGLDFLEPSQRYSITTAFLMYRNKDRYLY